MANATFTWTLEAYEQHGNLCLKWKTTAPFRAQQDQIHVYHDGFPPDPAVPGAFWIWADKDCCDTGLPWGTGWNCAYIAQAAPNGPYIYFIRLTTDATMGSDVKKINSSLIAEER
jgi:hypothetical protein